ncbi:MAG: methyltransferase domain-containing protein [Bacteroidota bacterium]|nr:methyltransferase domain-containing protein [Bacteroidota bacterium]
MNPNFPAASVFAGNIPGNYDRHLGPLLFEPYAIDLVARINPTGITSVLEEACGTGRLTRHLRKRLPSARLVGIDLNTDMITIAKTIVNDNNIEWVRADMQALPFDSDSFDLVVCQCGVMFVPDKLKALQEVRRVLRRGGSFIFNTWDRIEYNGVPHIVNEVLKQFFPVNTPAFFQVPFCMDDKREIKNLLQQAGFSNSKIESVKAEGRITYAKDAAKGFVEGTPIYEEIIKADPSLPGIIQEAITQEIIKKYGNDPVISPLQAWVCEAKKETDSRL